MVKKGEKCPTCGRYYSREVVNDCVIVRDGKILLGLRNENPQKDFWALIGGYLDWGETLEESVYREIKEELGVESKIMKLHSDLIGMVSSPPSSAELKSAEAEESIHLRSYDQSLLRRRIKMQGVYSDPKRDLDGKQNVSIVYVIELLGEPFVKDPKELKEIQWFDPSNLPGNIAFDHRKIIEDYKKSLI